MSPFPARLHVLLARDAPTAVVIRRGPAKMACSIGWDRERDEFTVGQWLKGRIYERWGDISPDGRYWLYFAADHRRRPRRPLPAVGETWTAVARVPYLKALALYRGIGTWHGGGLFTGRNTYLVEGSTPQEAVIESNEVHFDRRPDDADSVRDHDRVQLTRDGWSYLSEKTLALQYATSASRFERPVGGGWTLRQTVGYGVVPDLGRPMDTPFFRLIHRESRSFLELPDWDWADWDRHRLVWAAGGCLWTGQLGDEGLQDERMLHDFNAMTFEPIKAPY